MINQYEVPDYMHNALPGIDKEIKSIELGNPFKLMQALVRFTTDKVNCEDMGSATKCFKLADKLYEKGNKLVKNAVDNVFVYSLTNILALHPNKRSQILALLPITIYTLYIHQLQSSGC